METQDSFAAARVAVAPQEPVRVYRIKKGLVITAIVLATFLALIAPGIILFANSVTPTLFLNTGNLILFAVMGLICFGLAVFCYWALIIPELKVTPQELYYRDFGFAIKTSWSNVMEIGSVRAGSSTISGLVLGPEAEFDTEVSAGLKTLFFLQPFIVILAILSGRYAGTTNRNLTRVVPVDKFQSHWKDGELGQQIEKYAPWLFNSNLKPGEYPPAGTQPSGQTWQAAPVAPAKIPSVLLVTAVLALVNLAVFGALFFIGRSSGLYSAYTIPTNGGAGPVAWSKDGKLLAVKDFKSVSIYDMSGGVGKPGVLFDQAKTVFDADTLSLQVDRGTVGQAIESMALSPDGKLVAVGNSYGEIVLWDVPGKKKIVSLKGHTDEINTLAFSPDGKYLASGSGTASYSTPLTKKRDNSLILWDLGTNQQVKRLAFKDQVIQVYFGPDGKLYTLSNLNSQGIIVYNTPDLNMIDTIKGASYYYRFDISADGKTMAAGQLTPQIDVWDLGTKKIKGGVDLSGRAPKDYSYLDGLALSPDGTSLAALLHDTSIRLVNIAPGGQTSEGKILTFEKSPYSAGDVRFSPDGKQIVLSDSDNLAAWSLDAARK